MAQSTVERDPLVFRWVESSAEWVPVSWGEWFSFRGGRAHPFSAGDHRFVVCVVIEDGTIANIIPHRYQIDDHGQVIDAFDGLDDVERAEVQRIMIARDASAQDTERYRELMERGWRLALPAISAARELLRSLPTPLSADKQHGYRHFIEACGGWSGSSSLQ